MAKTSETMSAKAPRKAKAVKSGKKTVRPLEARIFPRYAYVNNLIVWEAWKLPDISRPTLSKYAVRGVLELYIQTFDAKFLHRRIHEKAYSPLLDDAIAPGSLGHMDNMHPQPLDANYSPRTRWDMNGGVFIDHNPLPNGNPAPKQRVLIKITNLDGLVDFFADVPAVTAKDQASQRVLVNLEVDPPGSGPRTARFWLLYEGGSAPPVVAGFNIALLVTDREDSTYSVPIIVDPKVPNRG